MTIEASNKQGPVRISYVDEFTRKYEWSGRSRTIKLIPREDRFRYEGQIGEGILGLYEPATSWFFAPRERLVVQEAERHFKDEQEARRFLTQSSNFMDWVYTNDGLVVGFSKMEARGGQVNIDIWQLVIGGVRPKVLIGAKPDAIQIRTR